MHKSCSLEQQQHILPKNHASKLNQSNTFFFCFISVLGTTLFPSHFYTTGDNDDDDDVVGPDQTIKQKNVRMQSMRPDSGKATRRWKRRMKTVASGAWDTFLFFTAAAATECVEFYLRKREKQLDALRLLIILLIVQLGTKQIFQPTGKVWGMRTWVARVCLFVSSVFFCTSLLFNVSVLCSLVYTFPFCVCLHLRYRTTPH